MALRSIVCLHNGYEFEGSSLATAIALTKEHGAHLRIIHAEYVVRPAATVFGEAAIYSAGWQEAVDRQLAADRTRAKETAHEAAAAEGMLLTEGPSDVRPRAEFISMQGFNNRTLIRTLSVSDLIVMGGQAGGAGWAEDSVANLALFSTGRPILLVRPIGDSAPAVHKGGTVMIAWSPAPEAIHALLAAAPLLTLADSVHLVSATASPPAEPSDDEALALSYLAAHGVKAKRQPLATGSHSPAEAVLAHATEVGCDTLVMGAYGHSLFREMLIGGFSETMIAKARFPLLLCH